ncbi:MAG: aldo/keto reductase [Spirochaetales bacterium]
MIDGLTSTTTLHNQVEMPWFGLGVFKVSEGADVERAVQAALEVGYRSIDTAAFYGNEAGVGRAIADSDLSRDDIFVTSKVWNDHQGYDAALRAFDASMAKLNFEYLDLYLIHWPLPRRDLYRETWKALERLYHDGRVRAIGVSNFTERHLERLLSDCEVKPMVNQVEYHPRLTQESLHRYCRERGIQLEAWSPLMRAKIFDNPTLREIAERHEKSVAQVVLRWDLQNGVVTIPKSVNPSRIASNAQVFDFELSSEDMARISALNTDTRVGPDPDELN